MTLFSMNSFSAVENESVSTFDQTKEEVLTYMQKVYVFADFGISSRDEVVVEDGKSVGSGTLTAEVGASFPIRDEFYAGIKATFFSSKDDDAVVERDKDIFDGSGKRIRLVSRSIEYEAKEDPFLSYVVQRRFRFNNGSAIMPYLSYGRASGQFFASRFDKTDRENPVLFSKHNRYTLTSDVDYKRDIYGIGATYLTKGTFTMSLGLELNRVSYSNERRGFRNNDEAVILKESDYDFAKFSDGQTTTDTSITLRIGGYF